MTRDVKTFISITVVSLYRPSKTMDMHIVTVYDVGNKFIAYSGPVPEVSHVLSEWGSLFCLASDGKVKIYVSYSPIWPLVQRQRCFL